MDVGAPELLIILAVVLLLVGPSKLPKLARSLGEAVREFRHHREDAPPTP
jgi:TatA/E family protein of Tat protein translocase